MAKAKRMKVNWQGDRVVKATHEEVRGFIVETAQHIVVRSKDKTRMIDTGHNKSSMCVVDWGGVTGYRQGPQRSEPFTDPRRFHKPDRVVVATSSGYGGFVETGTSQMQGEHVIRASFVGVMRDLGLISKRLAARIEKRAG